MEKSIQKSIEYERVVVATSVTAQAIHHIPNRVKQNTYVCELKRCALSKETESIMTCRKDV